MAAFRADLEADEPQRQATALLQLLNAVAGGRDVASAVAYACQGIVRGPAAPAVKRLAYELVRTAALADADWEHVGEGLKTDLAGAFSPEARAPSPLCCTRSARPERIARSVRAPPGCWRPGRAVRQVAAAALGALGAAPPRQLAAMLADGALGARLSACLGSGAPEVRAAATAAAGAWLADRGALAALAGGAAAAAERALDWAGALGDALLDPAPAPAAAAWAALGALLAPREAARGAQAGEADALRERGARRVAGRALAALAAVLGRARALPPDDQARARDSSRSAFLRGRTRPGAAAQGSEWTSTRPVGGRGADAGRAGALLRRARLGARGGRRRRGLGRRGRCGRRGRRRARDAPPVGGAAGAAGAPGGGPQGCLRPREGAHAPARARAARACMAAPWWLAASAGGMGMPREGRIAHCLLCAWQLRCTPQ